MAKGTKTGGRKKGVPNKSNAAREQAIISSGLTPLDYLIAILRDEGSGPNMRLEAAKAAAPYVHPRLAAIELSGDPDNPLRAVTRLEFAIVDAKS